MPMTIEKDTSSLDHAQALNDHGIMVLMAGIEHDTVAPVVEWILHENYVRKKKLKELIIMICSEGGELAPAFALIDVMKNSKIPIKTVGLGQIASCGLLIFLSGTPGRRVLTPNTSILSHQFSWGSEGKAHELFATVKEFELIQHRMINLYKSSTNLDEETIKKVLLPAQDVYLSAEEALSYGICDHIG
jgi:ATP-dependent Clp protease protease subunit